MWHLWSTEFKCQYYYQRLALLSPLLYHLQYFTQHASIWFQPIFCFSLQFPSLIALLHLSTQTPPHHLLSLLLSLPLMGLLMVTLIAIISSYPLICYLFYDVCLLICLWIWNVSYFYLKTYLYYNIVLKKLKKIINGQQELFLSMMT